LTKKQACFALLSLSVIVPHAYIKHEVEAIIQARIEEQTPEQIKLLVIDLIKQRKAA
jgi:hypothetical protein